MAWPRSALLTTTTGIVLSLTLSLVLSLYSFVKSLHHLTLEAQKEVKLEIFFKSEPATLEIQEWIQTLREKPEIQTVDLITQEQAQNEFSKMMKQEWGGLALEASLLSRLPASVVVGFQPAVATKTREKIVEEVSTFASQFADYDGFIFQKDWAQWFSQYAGMSRNIFLGLSGFCFLVLFFIISNLTRAKLVQKLEEMQILSFLGATPWQVQKKFVLESVLMGGASALTGGLIVHYGFRLLKSELLKISHLISPEVLQSPGPQELLIFALAVMLLCGISAKSCLRESHGS